MRRFKHAGRWKANAYTVRLLPCANYVALSAIHSKRNLQSEKICRVHATAPTGLSPALAISVFHFRERIGEAQTI
jgi:hypothetical protein